jgi:hypothetical protein
MHDAGLNPSQREDASIVGGNAFSKSTQLIKILLDAAVKEVVEVGEPALELSVSF